MSQLLKRRPTAPLTDPFAIFDQGLSTFFRSPMTGWNTLPFRTFAPGEMEFLDIDLDMYEKDGDIVIDALLPGVNRDDLDVTVVDDILTIRAERKAEKVKKEGKNFFRKELTYGSLMRTVPMPTPVDEDRVTASFKDGMLTIHAPKADVLGNARSVPID
ncbi:MAG: Hsp20/alpha crystallin family protein [Phycisphaeraceae bacterium]|nr:Hsp20/alpha crystallin family protein [Phycisphaeraceae bacterium]